MADESAAEEPASDKVGVMPPYTAFQSLKSTLAILREHGVPTRIDRSVLSKKFNGAVVTQVLTALRFLRLITTEGVPSQTLRDLVDALDTETWSPSLSAVLRNAYAPIFELDLEKATSSQFADRFRDAYKAEGETGRKCTTFFLNATREAKIAVSPYLVANAKPRTAGAKRRKTNGTKPQAAGADTGSQEQKQPDPSRAREKHAGTVAQQLLDKFPKFDPKWPAEIQAKWFEGYDKLLERTN